MGTRTFNSILLHEPPFFREIESGRCIIRDASSLAFIIEEIVSFGAVGIAIPGNSLSRLALDSLPSVLKRRVKVVDKNLHILKMDRVIREPICQEFGLKRLHEGSTFTFTKKISRNVEDAICCIEFEWYYFLLGLEYGLQIDLDVPRLRKAVGLLRNQARDPQVRGILATFAGILATYKRHKLGVIKMVSVKGDELVNVFEAFLEDETYRSISKEFHDLGFPSRLKARLSRIGTLSRRLVRERIFKNVVDIGTKVITAATQVPLPEAELGERLLQKKYLPPIAYLQHAIDKAFNAWTKSGCELMELKGCERRQIKKSEKD
jgi:hypothetical protein